MTRSKTPDVLDDVMSEKEGSNKEIKSESKPKQAYLKGTSPVEAQAVAGKEKATFNLSKRVLRDLESAWFEVRSMRGDRKVKKTDMVEHAIEEALQEFFQKRERSDFYASLARNKTIKP